MPNRSSVPIEVTTEERQELRDMQSERPRNRYWIRAEVVLRAADGQTNYVMAKELRISRNTVKHWRYRFARERLAGLRTRPIPGRPKTAQTREAPTMQQAAAQTLSPAR